jgi:hypothetical protein
MKKTIIIAIILVILLSQSAVFASQSENRTEKGEKVRAEKQVKIQKEVIGEKTEEGEEDEKAYQWERSEMNGDFLRYTDTEFMAKGKLSSVDTSSFAVMGKTIKIDKSITEEYMQVGELKDGMHAIVKGIIKDGNYYAEKVIVNNRYKLQERERHATPSAKPTKEPKMKDDDKEKGATDSSKFKSMYKEMKEEQLENRIGIIEKLIEKLQDLLAKLQEKRG